jgi:hypothetical protein
MVVKNATAAQNLLALLKDAAETEDFVVVAETLKRMLQPCGLRLMKNERGESDVFTKEDSSVIVSFWNTLLDLRLGGEETVIRVVGVYSLILAASIECEFPYMKKQAGLHCQGIATLCGEMLAKFEFMQEAAEHEPKVRPRPKLRIVT